MKTNPAFFRFLKKSTLATIILFALGWIIFSFLLPQYYLHIFPVLLLFFYGMSLGIQYILYEISKLRMGKFSTRFMGITMARMFILMILVFVYLFVNKQNAIAFVVVFFILYIVYTFIEVQDMLAFSNKK